MNQKWVLFFSVLPFEVWFSYRLAIDNSEGDLTSEIGLTVLLSYCFMRLNIHFIKKYM